MKIKYIGESRKGLESGRTYNIDFNINPYYNWVNVEDIDLQLSYGSLTSLLLEWDLLKGKKIVDFIDFSDLMMKLP
jgi:hypothetical protein